MRYGNNGLILVVSSIPSTGPSYPMSGLATATALNSASVRGDTMSRPPARSLLSTADTTRAHDAGVHHGARH